MTVQTVHALIAELDRRSNMIAAMNLSNELSDEPLKKAQSNLLSNKIALDRVCRAIEGLITRCSVSAEIAKEKLSALFPADKIGGPLLELYTYEWLQRKNIRFQAQKCLGSDQILGKNCVVIDGIFCDAPIVFDVKAMGFQENAAADFKALLEERFPGRMVSINGSMDVSPELITKFGFKKIQNIVSTLRTDERCLIPELDWTIMLSHSRTSISRQRTDPYALAEKARYFFFYDAHQFTRSQPFLLICPYDAEINQWLSINFQCQGDIMLRALARRTFMQFSCDLTPAKRFAHKITTNETLSDVASLLSGLLFVNLDLCNTDNDSAKIFLNPRATNQINDFHMLQVFQENLQNIPCDRFLYDEY